MLMKRFFCFVLTLVISTHILPAYAETIFTDVDTSSYCYDAVANVKNAGIITGYDDGSFKPQNLITRAEMATVMCLMSKADTATSDKGQFSDVPSNHWAADFIHAAAQKNIISGSGNGLFRPDDNLTFEEAVKMTVMATEKGENIPPTNRTGQRHILKLPKPPG